MALTRVQVTLPYFTGIPEDVATNTFYYGTVATPTVPQRTAMIAGVRDFYTANSGSGSIDQYLSLVLSRGADACEIKTYDMDTPEPRVPMDSETMTLGNAAGATSLPTEVALCLSYRAAFVSGTANARRRGRIYLGPLQTATGSGGSGAAFPIPTDTFRNIILDSAEAFLAADPASVGCVWDVYSPTDTLGRKIVEAWVDNAYDTQRRRGQDPTNRLAVAIP